MDRENDCISRQQAIEAIADIEVINHDQLNIREGAVFMLEQLPPVTPTKRATETMIVDGEETEIDPVSYEIGYTHGQTAPIERTGEWIKNDDFTCSACGYHMIVGGGAYNYCPNCGAKMKGVK